jgi:hypothetical protein
MSERILAFYYPDDITLFHTLFPFVTSKRFRGSFEYTTDTDYVLKGCKSRTLLIFRLFKRKELVRNSDFFTRLRDKYPRLIYVDDADSSDEINTSALPHVDIYLKKQLYKDKALYLKPTYGKRLYTDYYHRARAIDDHAPETRPPLQAPDVAKLRLLWNLGIGCYPKSRIRNGLARRLHPFGGIGALGPLYRKPRGKRRNPLIGRTKAISARYNRVFDKDTVRIHRELYDDRLGTEETFWTERVPLSDYNRELAYVAAVFSPFGWGEICFRDFEAMSNKALLIKPSVEHLETWPGLFVPNQTYIPVDWDAKDFASTCQDVLGAPERYQHMVDRAEAAFFESYARLDDRLEEVISAIEAIG